MTTQVIKAIKVLSIIANVRCYVNYW